MTTVEILQTDSERRFLHVHSARRATVLAPINECQCEALERTIRDPTPIQDRGQNSFEVVEGGGEEMFIFVELEGIMTTLVPIESDEDIQWLKQTIRSPHPFNGRKASINRI